MKSSERSPLPVLPRAADDQELCDRGRELERIYSMRRTVRDFSDEAVPRELIESALRAAGSAPSGANQQPWFFCAVSSPELKRKIRLAAEEEEQRFYNGRAPDEWLDAISALGTDEHKPFLETAPWLIVVFEQRWSVDEKGKRGKHYYSHESTGLAAGMLVSHLHQCGLATLTHTPSPMHFLRDILGRPLNERPFLLLVTGWPSRNATVPAIERKSLAEISDFR